MTNLAINGGSPFCQPEDWNAVPWPPVSEATAERLKELYLSGEWSFNSQTEQDFEQAYAAYHDAKHGIYMANGTVTLECALLALGVGPGDEVIVPGLTWIATAMAVRYVGAKLVFADVEPDTFCLDPNSVEARITSRTKCIIPVHLYGSMANLKALLDIAKKRGIYILEDCAHMQGGKWEGKGVGSWGDIGSFSFQQSKTLAAGEGGICITNNSQLADRIYRAKHIGYGRGGVQGQAASGPEMGLLCHNYRGLALTARILLDQLPDLDKYLQQCNLFYKTVKDAVADVEGFRLQTPGHLATRQGYYAMAFAFDEASWGHIPKDRLLNAMAAEGMKGVTVNYGPVYSHILFNLPAEDFQNDGCPTTDAIGRSGFVILHYRMQNMKNAEVFSGIIHKLSANRKELI